MRYDSDAARDFMPPNDPWEEHNASEDAKSYLTLYYCEDDISKYPVREVTKVNDNKSDPNLETMSYGLCSTCTRDIRSGLVKNDRPYLFFCTNYHGDRHLAGYYHIGWHSLGWPLLTNYRDGSIQDDYRLVADEMHWVYPPISFETVAEETGFDGIQSGFRKKLVGPDRTADLLALLHDREDYSERYIEEIRRLERINKRYHEYRYPTWEREDSFDWESVENYVEMATTDEDDGNKEILEQKVDEFDVDLDLITSRGVSDWFCLLCEHEFENEAPLKLCPNCDNGGGVIPDRAINA
ncbi:zinc-ribbon domain-containing protein [Natronomonas gomsonensis]|uniref:zinc-ribbon domain-containing protein n=1 Tax=Natronomonas gomsonensis TaxID=1046043 RepID=UPI0020CA833C|nr:zinc-ribbon domain-containing protein [Natronomonas gomsonensis]